MNDPVHEAVRLRPAVTTLGLLAVLVVALLALAGPALAATARCRHPVRRHHRLQEHRLAGPAPPARRARRARSSAGASLHDGRAPDLTLTLYDNTPGHQGPYDVPVLEGVRGRALGHLRGLGRPRRRRRTPSSRTRPSRRTRSRTSASEFDQRIWESDVFHFGNYAVAHARRVGHRRQARRDLRPQHPRRRLLDRLPLLHRRLLQLRPERRARAQRHLRRLVQLGRPPRRRHQHAVAIVPVRGHGRARVPAPDPPRRRRRTRPTSSTRAWPTWPSSSSTARSATASHIGEYLYYHRDSLTDWKGELFDYGDSVLWQDYLWERAGGGDARRARSPPA